MRGLPNVAFPRRDLLFFAAGSLPFVTRQRASAAAREYLVYWGTYTAGGPRYGTGESKGIYVSRFNAANGSLSPPELAVETQNPSYLAIHPNQRFLYSVNEHIDHTGKVMGEVSSFAIDRKTGRLRELSRVSSRGGMPCHISTDKHGKVLAVANWSTGSTATFPIRTDGAIGEATGFYQHSGERSGGEAPGQVVQVHCHAVVVSSDNRFLIATDTGLNKIFVHRLSIDNGTFAPHEPAFLGLKNPANPRHLVFHPNGKWAYVANEANPGCTMLNYDPDKGAFREASVTRTIPDGVTGRVSPAEAVMHPTGAFVYVSNRGHDSIAVLKIDSSDGSLTLVEARQPGGSGPRSFNIDPTGNWLFALMQRSNSIVPLRIDSATGRLTRSGGILSLPSPVCAKFVQLS